MIDISELTHENIGDIVIYVPTQAKGDLSYPDCEMGVITSYNDVFIFVQYGEDTNSKATHPSSLVFRIDT